MLSMLSLRHRASRSTSPVLKRLREVRRRLGRLTVPAPALVFVPLLCVVLAGRAVRRFLVRFFICEPLFKAYCRQYGSGLRTGAHLHWVRGRGDLVFGRDVMVDGKCGFVFASRFSERPSLIVGDDTGISHGCSFRIGKLIRIGSHCRIASGVAMFDSSGHPTDPAHRLAGVPLSDDDVRPIHIGNNVWIGRDAVVGPGVEIGEGSVVAARAVVMADVPPFTMVAGNPARIVKALSSTPTLEKEVRSVSDDPEMEWIAAAVCRIGSLPAIDPDEDIYEAGFPSIGVLDLLLALEERDSLAIPDARFIEARTVRTLGALRADCMAEGRRA